jgi:NADH-quinone oxidoreductase subunit N
MAGLIVFGAVFGHALIAALDLLVLFVSLSGLAVIGYALVSGAGTRRSEESAIRYLVQGSVATGLTLYGIALVFGLGGGVTGYVSAGGALSMAESRPALLALGLVLSAFAFKLGAFPFHSWAPDAYENADAPSVAFLASAPKVAAVIALLIVVRGTLFAAEPFAVSANLLIALGLGSLLFGSFGMLRQESVARLLGYSGIAQVGYALLAMGAGAAGIQATIIFIVTYAIGACAAFVAIEAAGRVRPGWNGTLGTMGGLAKKSPLLGASLVVIMLSLTGIPLFAGFWGKLHVFVALVESDSLWLALAAGVAAVVSFGGYGRVLRAAYFESAPDGDADGAEQITEPDTGEPVADPGSDDAADSVEPERGGAPLLVTVALALVIVALGVVPLFTGVAPVFSVFGL